MTDKDLLEYKKIWNLSKEEKIRRGWLKQKVENIENNKMCKMIDFFINEEWKRN